MTKYRIQFDKEGCIGAKACVFAAAGRYIDDNAGKVDLVDSEQGEDGYFYLEIEDEEAFKEHLEAAKVCPVTVLHITNTETGEQLI